ncbi:MAG: YncE family protein [Acidimicrobiales bacterium]
MAFVTLAGSGSGVGFGNTLVPVTISNSTGGPPVGSRIRVGSYPDAVAINSAGTMAYVANYSSNSVTPVNLATDKPGKPIPAGVGPADIAITPNGKMAYVTDDGSSSVLGKTVTPINLVTRKPGKPIVVGSGPQGIVITPNGATAYVTDAGAIVAGQSGRVGHSVTPIDLATGKAGKAITVGNGPTGIAISPHGSIVFVTNIDSQSVTPIYTATNTTAPAIAVQGGPVAVAVARGSAWVVDSPSHTYAGDNVTPISIATGRAGAPIPIPRGAQDIAIAPGSTTAWVTCLNADVLTPINLVARRAGSPIRVPGGPFALAIARQTPGRPASPTPSSSHHHKAKK